MAGRGSDTVRRTTTQVWAADGQDTPTDVSMTETSADGLRSWQTVRGLTTSTATVHDEIGGHTVTSIGPDGTITEQVFLGDRLVSTANRHPALGPLASTTNGYDAIGRLQTVTDARNGVTTYAYDPNDRLASFTTPDPDPARAGDGYDPQTTSYVYDAMGRVTRVSQPDGGVVNTTYYPTGAVKRTWGARTFPTEYTYDVQGRVKTLTTWQDFAGDSGRAVTTWNYDPGRGWLLNKRYADNTGPGYTYWPSGRLKTRTWARTPTVTTTYTYNNAGDVTITDYSDGTPDVNLSYDRQGRPQTITDASGSRTLAYHTSGQLQDESGTAGLLNGLSVNRSFDSLARLSGLAGTSVPSATYSYDPASRLQTVTSGADTATYAYVQNSPLVQSVTFANNGTPRLTTTKTYDNLSRLASVVNALSSPPSALSHAYTYNAANQRTRATREDGAYWAYDYDPLGQVNGGTKFFADGTPALGHGSGWTFDDIGNRKTATVNGQASSYTANSLNQYARRTVPDGFAVFGAAAPGANVTVDTGVGPQPVQRQGESFYRWVPADNTAGSVRTQVKVTGVKNFAGPGGEDAVAEETQFAYVPQSPEQFSHDADGNLTADARWTYIWDGENRLIAMETGAAAASVGVPRQKLEFTYNGQSRRIAKKVSNWSGSVWVLASSTLFLYDGWNMVAELNALSGNAPVRTYVWGLDLSGSLQGAGGVGGLVAIATYSPGSSPPDSWLLPAYDGNGNVIGLVNAADGTLAAQYDYNAFGGTVTIEGPAATANPFRFSTKFTDRESGHLYYGRRYYIPSTGRWLNRDPLEEDGGKNLYGFAENDPANTLDYLGLFGAGQRNWGGKEVVMRLEQRDPRKRPGFITVRIRVPKGHSDFSGGDEFDYVKEDTWLTSPIIQPARHFQPLSQSEGEIQEAIKINCSKDLFERAMHRGQDFFSHFDKLYRWDPFNFSLPSLGFGHLGANPNPDDDENAWNNAEKWTADRLAEWCKCCPCRSK